MKKIVVAILLILIIQLTNATELDNNNFVEYKEFRIFDNLEFNKVGYILKLEQNTEYNFKVNISFNNKFIDECKKTILLNENSIFETINCDVPKLGDGKYSFQATISNFDTNFTLQLYNVEYLFNNKTSNIRFIDKNNSTQIIITINTNEKNLILKNQIPKSVIESLTKENKNTLIESNTPYKIIESDPLIAWDIENPPSNINYTIKKKISDEQKKQFEIQLTKKENVNSLKIILFILIIIILGFILKPILKKNGKK